MRVLVTLHGTVALSMLVVVIRTGRLVENPEIFRIFDRIVVAQFTIVNAKTNHKEVLNYIAF